MTDDIVQTFVSVADALDEEHAQELASIEHEATQLIAEINNNKDQEKRKSILDRLLKRNV